MLAAAMQECRLSTIPEESDEEPQPTKSLAVLVRENADLRNKLCAWLSKVPSSSQDNDLPKTAHAAAAVPEPRGNKRGPQQDQPALFVSWEALNEMKVAAPEGARAPANGQDQCLLKKLKEADDVVRNSSNDSYQKYRHARSTAEAISEFEVKDKQGTTDDEASTNLPTSDSDSQEVSGHELSSSDSDSQEVSSHGEGRDSSSQKEALQSKNLSGQRSRADKKVSWSDQTAHRSCRVKAGSSTPLAAGLAPVACKHLPVQTTLLAGLSPADADPSTPCNTSTATRGRSCSAAGSGMTLKPGKSVQVRGVPAHSNSGTVLVVDHAESTYKVRMSSGIVWWLEADRVEPMPPQSAC